MLGKKTKNFLRLVSKVWKALESRFCDSKPPLGSFVTLGKLFNFPVPQCLYS